MKRPVVYFGTYLKASEGGPGTTWMVKLLRHHGIRAQSVASVYVGMSDLHVEQGKHRQAKKHLPKPGIGTSFAVR
jgi:hypothetical protein